MTIGQISACIDYAMRGVVYVGPGKDTRNGTASLVGNFHILKLDELNIQ